MAVKRDWVRDEENRREFARRKTVCVAASLPAWVIWVGMMIDKDRSFSILQVIPALRDVDDSTWFAIWGGALLGAIVFFAVIYAIYWRCPVCERFVGHRAVVRKCFRCEAPIASGSGYDPV